MNMLVSGAALLLACVAFAAYELVVLRQSMIQSLSVQAQIVGLNSVSALLFNDRHSAQDTLAALKAARHIISAGIYKPDGQPFAGYSRDRGGRLGPLPQVRAGQPEVYSFKGGQLVMVRAIIFEGKPTGTVVIRSDLEEMKSRLMRYGVIGALVLSTCLLAVAMISSLLRRTIAEPIVSLAETAKVVSREKNYSVRAAETGRQDEMGVLIDAFNEMLAEIQARDSEVRKLNEELERRVTERTIELEGVNRELAGQLAARKQFEQALQDKNIELENAILAKDRFLASMSHELRTPLNAIIGFTGTLLMKLPGPLTEDQSKQLQTIRSSARHLLSLISDLLDLAKIGSGKIALHIELVDCRDVVEEVSNTLRPLAEKKGLGLNITFPDGQVVVNTDRRALSQTLLNLANNAIKFTDEGQVQIVLSRCESNGKSWTELNVHDTGVGIPPEDQPKLFQAFSQAERNPRRHEGTGLGLHLSQKLAELLGGKISFRSEYGKGSTFTLCLPERERGELPSSSNEGTRY
jgi:signal transduction histidine kinase